MWYKYGVYGCVQGKTDGLPAQAVSAELQQILDLAEEGSVDPMDQEYGMLSGQVFNRRSLLYGTRFQRKLWHSVCVEFGDSSAT